MKKKKLLDDLREFKKEHSNYYKTYIKTSAVGLEFTLSIIAGLLLGYFFDKYFHTSPIALIVGLLIGFIAALKVLINFVKKINKNDNSKE